MTPQEALDELVTEPGDKEWVGARNAWIRLHQSTARGRIGEDLAIRVLGGTREPNNRQGYDIKRGSDRIEVKLACQGMMNGYPILVWHQIRPSDPYTHICFIAVYPNNVRIFLVPREAIPEAELKHSHGRGDNVDIFQILTRRVDELFPWMVRYEIEPRVVHPVAEDVAVLRGALSDNANERELLELITVTLARLRGAYRERESEFTGPMLAFLKEVNALQEPLRAFIEALDDRELVRSREDAEELATRFQELSAHLEPHRVAQRAKREFRQMLEEWKSLPYAAIIEADADHRRRTRELEKNAPVCGKCKNKMVLRESQHGLFWGCSAFPQCFSRRWLSKAENAVLHGAAHADRYQESGRT